MYKRQLALRDLGLNLSLVFGLSRRPGKTCLTARLMDDLRRDARGMLGCEWPLRHCEAPHAV